MFWNPEVITSTGKSLCITQIQFNIIYIMRTNIREFQHLCCRQKMSRINFIDCRFFAFGCVKPHCQFEIADVYSRTAKDRKCRNDVIKWCEPITAASLNKYGEVFCMAICCANIVRIVFEIGNCRLLNADFFRQLALRPAGYTVRCKIRV